MLYDGNLPTSASESTEQWGRGLFDQTGPRRKTGSVNTQSRDGIAPLVHRFLLWFLQPSKMEV